MTQKNKNLDLRKWLQKNGIFIIDIFDQLKAQGIQYPEQDFVSFSEKDFDKATKEWKKTPRNIKFNQAVTKLEKHWRRISKLEKSMATKKTKTGNKNKNKKDEDTDKPLRDFLKKNKVWDDAIIQELKAVGIKDGSKNELTKIGSLKQFDEFQRKAVLRRQPNLRAGLKKKIQDFKKLWKETTKIKFNMQTDKTKNSKSTLNKSSTKDPDQDLKDFLRQNKIWDDAILEELKALGVKNGSKDELNKIGSLKQFDEFQRKALLHRQPNLRPGLKKKILDFRKLWKQATEITIDMQTEKTKNTKQESKENEQEGRQIREYLKGTDVGAIDDIVRALVSQGVTKKEDLNSVDIKKWKAIHTNATNERNSRTSNTKEKQTLENKLNTLKKLLISDFGFSTTMQTQNTQTKQKKTETTVTQSPLVKELKKQTIWLKALEDELNRREIYKKEELNKIKSNDEFYKLYKQVKLEESANENKKKIQGIINKLNDFEKLWREISKVKTEIGFSKKKN